MTFLLPSLFQCGQPMERSRCLDCGAIIGGDNHLPVQGFQVVPLQYVTY